MDSTDLRIGNYVKDKDGMIGRVFNIVQSYCRVAHDNELEDSILYYENCQPIDLSDDILLRSGFESKSSVGHMIEFGYIRLSDSPSKSIFIRTQIGNTKNFYSLFNHSECDNKIQFICQIQYLHELQNIVHDIAKIELEINL